MRWLLKRCFVEFHMQIIVHIPNAVGMLICVWICFIIVFFTFESLHTLSSRFILHNNSMQSCGEAFVRSKILWFQSVATVELNNGRKRIIANQSARANCKQSVSQSRFLAYKYSFVIILCVDVTDLDPAQLTIDETISFPTIHQR